MNLFITSDKQGSGKTFITAGIAATMQSLGYSVGYYKPIQTSAMVQNGFVTSQDITFVKKIDPNLNTAISYVFKSDAMPMIASQKESVEIQPEILVKDYLKLRKSSEIVLVESPGGLLTPFSDSMRTIDFMQAMQTSMLLVVEPTHDVLEKVLLTIDYAKHSGVKVTGVILNKFIKSPDANIQQLPSLIEAYASVPIVGIVGYQTKITPYGLIDTVLHSIDLETIFQMKIPKLNILTENE